MCIRDRRNDPLLYHVGADTVVEHLDHVVYGGAEVVLQADFRETFGDLVAKLARGVKSRYRRSESRVAPVAGHEQVLAFPLGERQVARGGQVPRLLGEGLDQELFRAAREALDLSLIHISE